MSKMKISRKKRDAMYAAIYSSLMDARVRLKLEPKDDFVLAQVEQEIWRKQKAVLGLDVEHPKKDTSKVMVSEYTKINWKD
jgi:hypothetical protein